MRLINYRFYRLNLSVEQVEYYWKTLQNVKSFSDTDILRAWNILQKLDDELK